MPPAQKSRPIAAQSGSFYLAHSSDPGQLDLPPETRGQLTRAVVGSIILAWSVSALGHGLLGRWSVVSVHAIPIAGALVAGALYGRLRADWALWAGTGSSIVGILAIASLTGGTSAPALTFLAAVPILLVFLRGLRQGLAMLGAAVLGGGALAILEQVGALPEPFALLPYERGFCAVALVVIIFAFVVLDRRVLEGMTKLSETRFRDARRLANERDQARQAAERASEQKSTFLAIMSHELRTPLGGLLGLTTALETTKLDAEQRQIVASMLVGGESLRNLVNDVLDLERAERGHVTLALGPVDVESWMGGVLDLFATLAYSKGVEIAAIVLDDVPARIEADELRLRQVLSNLIGNAVKFTDRGEIVVEARYAGTVSAGMLEVEVRDTGRGIPADRVDTAFEPFDQGDATAARRFGGTGLGLSIVRRLVEAMGGSVTAGSTPGVGSTFTFRIPTRELPADRVSSVMPKVRALIVECSPCARRAFSRTIARHEQQWTVVSSREEAMRQLTEGEFEAVIVDADLPDDGAARLARWAVDERRTSIPFVLAVRPTDAARVASFRRRATFAATTIKPLTWNRVSMAIEQVLAPSESPRLPSVGTRPLWALVVDDDAINRMATRLLLTRAGHRVAEAPDGTTALRLIDATAYDVIFLDLHMPDMLGTEVAVAVRARPPGERARPFLVALTAAAFDTDRKATEAAGMDAFLTKPLDVSGLSAVLERAERTLVRAERKRQSVDLHVGEHIDLGRLTELEELAGDGAAAAALLEEFVSVAQEALEAVRTAGDAARLARAAHRLAGSASTIGAKRIAEMAADLEKRARGGEQPDVAPLIEAVANATFLLSARAARLRGDPATLASTLPPRTG